MFFSVVIPVFNRNEELESVCRSLAGQTRRDFEVIVVDDGSVHSAEPVCDLFRDRLNIRYIYKYNSGPGHSRNVGGAEAQGDFIIFFDSDVIVPPHYMETVEGYLALHPEIDAYGGPDASETESDDKQKAITYAMTSFFTTGGIRGGSEKGLDRFVPRSFNMGVSRKVWETTGGFSNMRFGEDMEFSYRVMESGFRTALIRGAYVYHKRRTDTAAFFKQVYFSGVARINLYKRFPRTLKIVHVLPALFALYVLLLIPLLLIVGKEALYPLFLACIVWFADSLRIYRSVNVSLMSVESSVVQLLGYGLGFLHGFIQRILLKRDEDSTYDTGFY